MSQQPPAYQRPNPPRHTTRNGLLAAAGIIALIIAVFVASQHAGSSSQSGQHTLSYIVTGDDATVTYGPSGSQNSGTVPMSVTVPLGNASYYAINAQLNGSGSVLCEIQVDGTVISESTASGGYDIALCEIVQDPVTGKWEDANSQ